MTKITQQWKTKLPAYQKAAEVTLDGFTFIGKRIDLMEWMEAGTMPDGLLKAALDSFSGGGLDLSDQKIAVKTAKDLVGVVRAVVCRSVIEPKIVSGDDDPKKDEVHYSQLPQSLRMSIFNWAMNNAPGVPVETKGGVTSVQSLEKFPENASGDDVSGAGV